jgi:AraC-like DNA-binding protein
MHIDPLSELIGLLRPTQVVGKRISGAGRWAVRYPEFGHPGFCVVTDGGCRLTVEGADALDLQAGDFVFLPTTPEFVMCGLESAEPQDIFPAALEDRHVEVHHGDPVATPDVRMLGGYFVFGSPDTAILVTLLPKLIHIRGEARLELLVRLVREESMQSRLGRELVLTRLVEVLLIEALRTSPGKDAPAGLLKGLADERLAASIRAMHQVPSRQWTVEQLARIAALSRSAYFDRFNRAVGMPPMEYLLAWRMAIAKDILDRQDLVIEQIAERVGYASASTFSTAFTRYVGCPPSHYMRERRRLRSRAA